jgi:hypothetical protein
MKKIIVFSCFFIFIVSAYIIHRHDLSFFGNITRTGQPPLDYEGLFDGIAREDLIWGVTYQSDNRSPISTGVYGFNKNLNLMFYIYKINLLNDVPLKKLIIEEDTPCLIRNEDSYQNIVADFDFKYLKDSVKPVSNIYLAFGGDSSYRTVIKNDSIAEYYCTVHNFSMRYLPNADADIFVRAKESNANPNNSITIGVLLLKRNDNLYMLLMQYGKNDIFSDNVMPYNIINMH